MKFSEVAQKYLHLNNKPYTLTNREVYYYFFDYAWPEILLYTGRQVAKSTSFAALQALALQAFNGFHMVHITPQNNQLSHYTNGRLLPFVRQCERSPSMGHKRLTKATMDLYFDHESSIHLRSAYLTADGARGLSGDWIFFDETQDLIARNIAIIKESASASEHPHGYRFFYAGTPKTASNTMDAIFKSATTLEPVLKCTHCGKHCFILYEGIEESGYRCTHCKRITDPRNYKLAWTNKRSSSRVAIRIPQTIIQPWDRIWRKKIDPLVSDAEFYNECLAMSYNIGSQPITKDKLVALSTGQRYYKYEELPSQRVLTFAGLDPGYGSPSNTVLTIGGFFPTDKKFHIIAYYKWSSIITTGQAHDRQIMEITEILKRFRVNFIMIDAGAGMSYIAELSKIHGMQVYSMMHVGQMKEMLRYEPENLRFKSNRSLVMQKMFHDLHDFKVELPMNCDDYHDDILNVYAEVNKQGKMIYNHLDTEPDDAFHSLMYCYYMALIFHKMLPGTKFYF